MAGAGGPGPDLNEEEARMNNKIDVAGWMGSSPTRREFLKISGLSAGALAMGPFAHLPFAHAKDNVYPSDKINYILPNRAGGDTTSWPAPSVPTSQNISVP